MGKRYWQIVLLVFLCGLLGRVNAEAQEKLEVFVSIPPQKWLCEQLGQEYVETRLLIAKGQEPHTFNPSPRQIQALSGSTLFFTVGLPFEQDVIRRLHRDSSRLHIIDTSENIVKIAMDGAGHGHKSTPDPHVWLSPPNLKSMAKVMAAAFIESDPLHEPLYRKNLWLLNGLLDDLDQSVKKTLAPFRDSSFFVFHPAFGYFANRYHLQQMAVETGGRSPTPKQLFALIKKAGAAEIKVIFVQPQFDPKSAEKIADAIGGRVVPLDSLAENVVENLGNMADEIAGALEGQQK